MKKLAFIVLLILATVCCFPIDFRNTSWQMNQDQVIASEQDRAVSETSFSGQEQIVYKTYKDGFPCNIIYTLDNDKLHSASYSFKNDQSMQIFKQLSQELLGQYGKPSFQTESLVVWRLQDTEIALAHLPDKTCYVAYWEKAYFAQMNQLSKPGQ